MKKVNIGSFVGCLLVLGSALLLQACSSAPTPLSKGAAEFNKQDYHAAFNDLLVAAKQGNSDAEYAVGYLYYNGLGVDKDLKLAGSWFQKSADQGNAKATKALAMISEAKESESFSAPPSIQAMDQ